ncbi:MAG: serine hydrolase domain-containing protein [Halieaceae bacterium]|jgi:D-alanyl-D-alanine carboxypeptidase|nr:serine hydrolase domain-containing protein [Halieaceae bacterium]
MTDSRAANLQTLLTRRADEVPGVLLGIEAPLHDLQWRGAAGQFCLESREPLGDDAGFRIASMSKTFTGVIAAQLVEEGMLDLSAPVTHFLPGSLIAKLPISDGFAASDINMDLLLHHRAGFNDFALSETWFAELSKDPGRHREPLEIATWAAENGHSVGAPGAQYHYSDTGFVLAGLVLEAVSGESYATLCRRRIFDPLDMHNTWLEGHESPLSTLSHAYLEMDGQRLDALQINGSCDWAAGGHVSTLADLDRFLVGLFNGTLFKRPETLDLLLAGPQAKPGFYYGLGIGRKQLRGKHLWGHLGHWGSFMYFCPEARLRVAGTLNLDQPLQNAFLEQVLDIVFSRGD